MCLFWQQVQNRDVLEPSTMLTYQLALNQLAMSQLALKQDTLGEILVHLRVW